MRVDKSEGYPWELSNFPTALSASTSLVKVKIYLFMLNL
jgi:hypothetical protein